MFSAKAAMYGVVGIDEEVIAASEDLVPLASEAPKDAPRDAEDAPDDIRDEPIDPVEDPGEEPTDGDVDTFIEGPVPLRHRRPLPCHPWSLGRPHWCHFNICFASSF